MRSIQPLEATIFKFPEWSIHAFVSVIIFPGLAFLIYGVFGIWAVIRRYDLQIEDENFGDERLIGNSAQLMIWSAVLFAATLFFFRLHSPPLGVICGLTGVLFSFASGFCALTGEGRAKVVLLFGHSLVALVIVGLVGWIVMAH